MSEGLRWQQGEASVRRAVEAWQSGRLEAEILHDNPRRRLLRLHAGETELLVKHYRTGSHHPLRERLKQWLGRSPADREFATLGALAREGVPVPRPLGLARLPGGDRLLVLPFLPGRSGVEGLAEGRRPRSRQLLALGWAIRRLHATGRVHGDLHIGNVLFQDEGAVLLDLQHARRARTARARVRDLGELDYSLWDRISAADRLRLRIAATTGGAEPPDRAWLRAVGRAARAKAWRHGRSRTRRLMRPGRLAAALRIARWRGLRWHAWPASAVGEALDAHEKALAGLGEEVLKHDRRSRITRVHAAGGSVIVKEVLPRRPVRVVADLVRGSAGRRGWRGGHGVRARGLRAALPLAFLEERRLGLPLRSWLLLEDRAPELELLELPSARREPALRALGPWLVRLHLRGIDHGDLKASHLFVDPEALDQGPALIDLESIAFRRRLRSAMRRLALVQLNASLPDDPGWSDELRRRVLRRYLLHEPLGGPEPEVVARIVRESLARRHRWRGRACTSAR